MEERAFECSGCERPASIIYKEIAQGKVQTIRMCQDCPRLKEKLGTIDPSVLYKLDGKNHALHSSADLCCESCHTTLQSVMMGHPLGCMRCYKAFEEPLLQSLMKEQKVPMPINSPLTKKKMLSLHLGKTPTYALSPDISNQMESLQAALNEAITRENYERAASLRDELKTLLSQPQEEQDPHEDLSNGGSPRE